MRVFLCLFASIIALSDAATHTVKPGDSIQKAIDKAMPGDTVKISDGTYIEDLVTMRDGEKDKRITITGSRKAVLHGTGKENRLFQIHHDYITVNGFTIDGQMGDGKKEDDYIDKLLYAHGNRKPRVIKQYGKEFRSAIDGLIISNMVLKNAGGECSRMRYFVTNAEYFGNHVERCGVHDFEFGGMKAVNGELLYIGTSSNQWDDGKNPTPEDESRYIHVHHNMFISKGNEVDVKEGSKYVLIEHNTCTQQLDPNSACLDSRTDNVIFRYNEVYGNVGAGVRIGGHTIKGHTFGQNNEVYGNIFRDNRAGAVKVQTGPHGKSAFCDNKCKGDCKIGGSASDDHKDIEGKCSDVMDTYWVDVTKAEVASKTDDSVDEEREPEIEVKMSGDVKKLSNMGDSKCYPVKIKDIKASSAEGENTARSAIDGKAITRWSSNGKDSWLEVDFYESVEVNAVEISFYKGDERNQMFDVFVEGSEVLKDQVSTGKTLAMQKFPFKPTKGSTLTIMGLGNSMNDWNSLTEMIVCGTSESKDYDVTSSKGASQCETLRKLDIAKISSTSDDGNKVENVLDGDMKTRWSAEGPGPQEIVLELEEPSFVMDVGMATFKGDSRMNMFDILVMDSTGWQDVIVDGYSNRGLGVESYDVGVEEVQQVKIVFYGYEEYDTKKMGTWNSVTEVELYGC